MGISPAAYGISMDIQILSTAFLSFFLFLAVLAVVFRMTRQEEVIVWMIRIFVGIGIVIVGARAGSWGIIEYIWWASLYGLLTGLFVLGPFSNMEASVTLRIFSDIARTGGVVTDRSQIVQRRIARLLYSGEIIKNQGTLMLGKTSYFTFREGVIGIFRRLFP